MTSSRFLGLKKMSKTLTFDADVQLLPLQSLFVCVNYNASNILYCIINLPRDYGWKIPFGKTRCNASLLVLHKVNVYCALSHKMANCLNKEILNSEVRNNNSLTRR